MASRKSGQTMVEFAIVAGMLVLALTIVAVFLFSFEEFAGRVLDLVSGEYP